jgi:polygalacturonase
MGLAIAAAAVTALAALAPPVCNIRDHGAKGDGTTLDTTAIADAIVRCAGGATTRRGRC